MNSNKYFIVIILTILFLSLISCNNKPLTVSQLKVGTFKTFLNGSDYTSMATRNDSIQVETFNKKKDTFNIEWKSDFEYLLKKKNPITKLDKRVFIIKITGIHKNSYTFRAHFKGSNYEQTGKAVFIK